MTLRMRLAIVILFLLLLVAGCRTSILPATFAYIDENRLAAIYDLAHRRVLWKSEWPVPAQVGPAWSPDGNILAFACVEPSEKAQRIVLLNVSGFETKHITINRSDLFLEGNLYWDWSQSGRFLALSGVGYPKLPVVVVNAEDAKPVASIVTAGSMIWSDDDSLLCYNRWVGPAEASRAHDELVLLDLVIYKYQSDTEKYVKDTKGRNYPITDYNVPQSEQEKPPEQYRSAYEITHGWSKNRSGDWLISAGNRGETSWIFLFPVNSDRPTQIVKGDFPVWEPEPD